MPALRPRATLLTKSNCLYTAPSASYTPLPQNCTMGKLHALMRHLLHSNYLQAQRYSSSTLSLSPHLAALQRATMSSKALRLLANRKLVNTSSRVAPEQGSQRTTCSTPQHTFSRSSSSIAVKRREYTVVLLHRQVQHQLCISCCC